MNRPIEFRAYNIKEKRMYWNVQNAYDMSFCHNKEIPCKYPDDKCDHDFIPQSFRDVLENSNYIVTQFTGLLDKHGKKIFEGDIVTNSSYFFVNGIVEFVNGRFTAKLEKGYLAEDPKFGWWEGCEVIGNIFENSDLLESK